MPTFPQSPLSFRTAGFPQYGWKAGFPSGAFPDRQRLKLAPSMRRPTSSLHRLCLYDWSIMGLGDPEGTFSGGFPGIAMRLARSVLCVVPLMLMASGAFGADFTRAEVQSVLATAGAAQTPSFAGRSLAGLDLHELDFTAVDLSGADLSDADLRGAKLVAAKLVGAKLPRAKLNLAWIMRADFSHADLSGAILETLIVSAGMETLPNETARFVGANLSGAKVTARFSLDDMHGADLSYLRASADMRNQSMGLIRTDFSRANLADVNFEGAALAHVNFEFAKLQRANFSGADLSDADLAGADLTDANLTGAKTTGTKFTSASLTGVRGLSPR
jgi:uncharacterized protein YjbI with pentapeptide repeats